MAPPRIPDLPATIWEGLARLENLPEWPVRTEAGADAFVRAAAKHQLVPFAAGDTRLAPLPRAAAERHWEGVRPEMEEEARAWDKELTFVAALFASGEYLVNKGAAYRRTIYPDPSTRPMNDIDVVIPKSALARSIERLLDAGYATTRPHDIAHGYFVRPAAGMNVELHTFFTEESRHAIDYAEVFRLKAWGALGVPHLAPSHALIRQTLELASQLYDSRIRKYLDLWLLARVTPDVVPEAIETAARWKVRRVFHAGMHLLSRLFPGSDTSAWAAASASLLGHREARHVERFVLPPRPSLPLESRPVQVWRKLGLLDTSAIRARFVARQMLWRAGLVE